jgi:hypothetical protein
MEASEDLRVQAVHRHEQAFDRSDLAAFLSPFYQHCEQNLDNAVGEVPIDGNKKEVTGRQLINYMVAMHAPPELRVREMRRLEKMLDSAAYLVAAMHDPERGIALSELSLEVRDSLEALTEEIKAVNLPTPYLREDGGLAV